MACVFFFCKQKTAYEMRISDWSSDVCSSDLDQIVAGEARLHEAAQVVDGYRRDALRRAVGGARIGMPGEQQLREGARGEPARIDRAPRERHGDLAAHPLHRFRVEARLDRRRTRLNSSH